MADHAPVPWRCGATKEGYGPNQRWVITDDLRYSVGAAQGRANAEFIVRACNAHEELLAALERLMSLEYHCDYSDEAEPEVCPGDPPEVTGPCHWCEARAAIGKAKGE